MFIGKAKRAVMAIDCRLAISCKVLTRFRGQVCCNVSTTTNSTKELRKNNTNNGVGAPAKLHGDSLVAIPEVDLILELHNISDKDIQVLISGDPTILILNLKG